MGLDMYLTKKIYIGAQYDHNKIAGMLKLTQNEKPIEINLAKVASITESSVTWRKSNQIHGWFVNNVQNGTDDCKKYQVSFSQLTELKNLCIEALKTRDPEILPTASGFFFGSQEYDESYWGDVLYTLEQLNLLTEGDYAYQASW